MANALYPNARRLFLAGGLNWTAGTVKVQALADRAADPVAQPTWAHLSDLDGSTFIGAAQAVTGRAALDDGVAAADNVSPGPVVGLGDVVQAIVLYVDTGTPATSTLIYYADQAEDTSPLAREGDGGTVPIMWSLTSGRVFRI